MFSQDSPLECALRDYLTRPEGARMAKLLLAQAALHHIARVRGTRGVPQDARAVVRAAVNRASDLVEQTRMDGSAEQRDLVLRRCGADPSRVMGTAVLGLCDAQGGAALRAAVALAARLLPPLPAAPGDLDGLPATVDPKDLEPCGHAYLHKDGWALVPCLGSPAKYLARPEHVLLLPPLAGWRRVGGCPCAVYRHTPPVGLHGPVAQAGVRRLLVLLEEYCVRGLRMTRQAAVSNAWTLRSDDVGPAELHVSAAALCVQDLVVHARVPAIDDPGLQLEVERLNCAFVAGALRDLARTGPSHLASLADSCDPQKAARPVHAIRALLRDTAISLGQ